MFTVTVEHSQMVDLPAGSSNWSLQNQLNWSHCRVGQYSKPLPFSHAVMATISYPSPPNTSLFLVKNLVGLMIRGPNGQALLI